jgi:hypothetical protein
LLLLILFKDFVSEGEVFAHGSCLVISSQQYHVFGVVQLL